MDVELDIKGTLASLSDAVDQITSGKITTLRVTRVHFVPAAKLEPKKIVAIRKAHRMSQESFASALNVPRATVASWETGRKKPSGAALRLLELVDRQPELIDKGIERRFDSALPA